MYSSQQPGNNVWRNAYASRNSNFPAFANACNIGDFRREHPSTASEHLTITGREREASIVSSLYAMEYVRGEAVRDGRKWISECQAEKHEDAEQQSEDLGTHGGSLPKD
jgi:hypothetical protein